MSEQAEYTYDVFISYSHADRAWVWGELLPQLEGAGLKVCIDDRDFEIGVPSLVNMERAVDNSRHTLIVLTPAWVESQWTEFESLLAGTADPAGRRRKLFPLMLKPCKLPPRIAMLTYADFTQPYEHAYQFSRLLQQLQSTSTTASPPDTPTSTPSVAPAKDIQIRREMLELLYEASKGSAPGHMHFNTLTERLNTSPETAQFHLNYLEKQGYVALSRKTRGARIVRYYSITPEGIDSVERRLV